MLGRPGSAKVEGSATEISKSLFAHRRDIPAPSSTLPNLSPWFGTGEPSRFLAQVYHSAYLIKLPRGNVRSCNQGTESPSLTAHKPKEEGALYPQSKDLLNLHCAGTLKVDSTCRFGVQRSSKKPPS